MSNRKKLENHKIVGEGSYGCVVEPALSCTTPEDYENKVSKVMTKSNAKKELKEYDVLKKIDGIEQYTLQYPVYCDPKMGLPFTQVVRNCQGRSVRNAYKTNPRSLGQLLLENGGVDLSKFMTNLYPAISDDEKNIFLTEILELIKGLQFFHKHDIIHQDIKKGNIVYNVKTGKIKYIDFGLMVKKSEFIKSSKKSRNNMAQTWDYYPPEFSCANYNFFSYASKCLEYRQEYHMGNEIMYDDFIRDLANTFDSYCLGLALRKVMKEGLKSYESKKSFFREAYELFKDYSHENIFEREDDLQLLHDKYKNLLRNHNVYSKSTPSPSPKIVQEAETLSLKSDAFITPREKGSVAKTIKKKPCPPKKPDLNPKTQKCVSACKTGKIRNINFRCVKPQKKVIKTRKIRFPLDVMQSCLDKGKDYNAKTNRCVKKCKPTQIRNEKFRCVANRSAKRR